MLSLVCPDAQATFTLYIFARRFCNYIKIDGQARPVEAFGNRHSVMCVTVGFRCVGS